MRCPRAEAGNRRIAGDTTAVAGAGNGVGVQGRNGQLLARLLRFQERWRRLGSPTRVAVPVSGCGDAQEGR